jgi:parallel beta-helix repeat protein
VNKTGLTWILVLAFLMLITLSAQPAKSNPRSIVVPDDYSTIQEAVSHAENGDTVFVKNGIYSQDENSTIVVSKTLLLTGEDPAKTVILGAATNPYENNIAIRLAAPNITISGFTIRNFGVGIVVANYYSESYPSGCEITNNNIVNNSEGIRPQRNNLLISGNNVTKNISGITGYNTEDVTIARNNISENRYGVNIGTCRNITVSENRISNNTGGLNLGYFGPYFVYGNDISGNSWGIRFAEFCSNATVIGNNFTHNDVGVALLIFPNGGDLVVSGIGNTVYGNRFISNTGQVSREESSYNYPNSTRMGTDIVSWDNGAIGNYWSDYSGIDDNNDGIGDAPYVVDENNKDRYPLMTSDETLPLPTPTPTTIVTPTPSPEPPSNPTSFPTTLVIVTSVGIALAVIASLVYLKSYKSGKKVSVKNS